MSRLVEDALRRLRTLLRFHDCYVADVRSMLEDLSTREIADALVGDSHLRRIHGNPALVKKIEALEAEVETTRAQLDDLRLPRLVPKPTAQPASLGRAPERSRDRTICVNGHPLTGDNAGTKNGRTYCRTCHREYMREYARRKAAERKADRIHFMSGVK